MITIITGLIWFICGLLNGIMDAIKFHDSYKHWGHFWSADAWKDFYDNKHSWFERIMKASFDAWHVAKLLMIILFSVTVVINTMCPIHIEYKIAFCIGYPVSLFGLFSLGFGVTYGKK